MSVKIFCPFKDGMLGCCCIYAFFTYFYIKSVTHESKIDKLNFIMIKNFCSVKDTIKRMKKQIIVWKQNTYLTKDLYLNIKRTLKTAIRKLMKMI